MTPFLRCFVAALATAALVSISACSRNDDAAGGERHEHQGENDAVDVAAKGPHGGRLLVDGDFGLEVTIFERGVPPEYRLYAYEGDRPIAPAAVKATLEVTRLGGRTKAFTFNPEGEFLRGDSVVEEPHSFDVKVLAQHANDRHEWSYSSYEGRTVIAAEMAKAAGVEVATAGPGVLKETARLYGSIQPDAERVRNVTARFPGVIRSVSRSIGDAVEAGDLLATVESNESLQVYAVIAPISGVVTARRANVGENTGTEALFVVADFSSVWAELNVFPRDHTRLKPGQQVRLKAADAAQAGDGIVSHIAAGGAAGTQGIIARVLVDNTQRLWTPGLFVTADVTIGEQPVPLAVPLTALQTFRDWTVVFVTVGDTYEARPLEPGRRDSERVEVLQGLNAGDRIVVANSYLIKADIEKSGASHEH